MSGERIAFDAETVMFGFLKRKHMPINSIIISVKSQIFSQSRNRAYIVFANVVEYLQYYNYLEKLMLKNSFFFQLKIVKVGISF